MFSAHFRLDYPACKALLRERLGEKGSGRIQLLTGPRQVGKTTLLLELAEELGERALYRACDSPAAALPGFWERLWGEAEAVARTQGEAIVFLDEIQQQRGWAASLKSRWDAMKRRRLPVQLVATGSSAPSLSGDSRESLAGRFERLTLCHWSARALHEVLGLPRAEATMHLVLRGGYPGAVELRDDPPRQLAYLRDAIVEPALGRDLLALTRVRRPALLRQVFAFAATAPAQIVSLQKLQGQLQDRGALETLASYLHLLEEAYLVAALQKAASRPARQRRAPPKLVPLDNGLCAAVDLRGPPDPEQEPDRFGAWVENACLAHLWKLGASPTYWREEPLEVDAVTEAGEGELAERAIEVKTGAFRAGDLKGLLSFCENHPRYRPLLVCDRAHLSAAERLGVPAMAWQDFLFA